MLYCTFHIAADAPHYNVSDMANECQLILYFLFF